MAYRHAVTGQGLASRIVASESVRGETRVLIGGWGVIWGGGEYSYIRVRPD